MKTFMKTSALAIALLTGASAATAANFGFQTTVEDENTITLDLIRADEAGVVVVYDYTGGEFGNVLGMEEISAGPNTDVNVTLDNNTAQDVAAVVYAGEMTEPSMAAGWIELRVTED